MRLVGQPLTLPEVWDRLDLYLTKMGFRLVDPGNFPRASENPFCEAPIDDPELHEIRRVAIWGYLDNEGLWTGGASLRFTWSTQTDIFDLREDAEVDAVVNAGQKFLHGEDWHAAATSIGVRRQVL